MDRRTERHHAIAEAVGDIRRIEARDGVTRASLARIRERLLALASRTDLFDAAEFPPPAPGGGASALYRLSEDDDHRFALYANASGGGHATPVHDHTTWAVIVGVTGAELNRFWERGDDGAPRERGSGVTVRAGTGVALMPEDLHSIHIDAPLLNFHMYGLALEQLHGRRRWDPERREWIVFPAHADIRDARAPDGARR